jgi:hypothetical protein
LKPDGSFEFASVPPGEYTVELQPQNLRLIGDRTHKLFAKELHFGTQTGLRKPITIVENGNPPLQIETLRRARGHRGKGRRERRTRRQICGEGRSRGHAADQRFCAGDRH